MNPVGYYDDNGAAHCEDCAPPEGQPIYGDSEADTPTHCEECGVLIEHALTSDGIAYVSEYILESFKKGVQNPVTRMWSDYYHACGYEIIGAGDGWELAWSDVAYLLRLLPMDMHPAYEQHRRLIQHAA